MTYRKLSHSVWECKYHVVFVPKYRKGRIYGRIRRNLGGIFHELARHKESVIEEGSFNASSCSYVVEYSAEILCVQMWWAT